MGYCWVPECKNRSEDGHKMHTFPRNEENRKIWSKRIGRADKEPSDFSKVCDWHFPSGNRNDGPTRFAWTEGKPSEQLSKSHLNRNKLGFPGPFRKRKTQQVEQMENSFNSTLENSKLCLLCRDKVENKTRTDSSYVLWAESCANSLRRLLRLDDSFESFFITASYCFSCLSLIRSTDFNFKTMKAVQSHLKKSRQKVKSLLRNNFRVSRRGTTNGCTDAFSPYDHAVKAICEALPNMNTRKLQKPKRTVKQVTTDETVPKIVSVCSVPKQASIPESTETNLTTGSSDTLQPPCLTPLLLPVMTPITSPISQAAPTTLTWPTLTKSSPGEPLSKGNHNGMTVNARNKLLAMYEQARAKSAKIDQSQSASTSTQNNGKGATATATIGVKSQSTRTQKKGKMVVLLPYKPPLINTKKLLLTNPRRRIYEAHDECQSINEADDDPEEDMRTIHKPSADTSLIARSETDLVPKEASTPVKGAQKRKSNPNTSTYTPAAGSVQKSGVAKKSRSDTASKRFFKERKKFATISASSNRK